MNLAALKDRLNAYNEREQQRQDGKAARRQDEAARHDRDEAVREASERIAAAIRASAPPPRAHLCEEPGAWCLDCTRARQAETGAQIALRIGGAG